MHKCRACSTLLKQEILDLGKSPPSNAYLMRSKSKEVETYYPLILMLCESCFLLQTIDYNKPEELFDKDYAYLSSTSLTWLKHSSEFTKTSIAKLGLTSNSYVVEIASNDGYLLQYFRDFSIPCLGVEPTSSTAELSRKKGIEVIEDFFNYQLSEKIIKNYKRADLIIANNVYAHVPDIVNFTRGIENLLSDDGVVSIEFPHLLNLILENQFDTVYHEHFSYLSLYTLKFIFEKCSLKILDVEELDTHGGSLRVWGAKKTNPSCESDSVQNILNKELSLGINDKSFYLNLRSRALSTKLNFLSFLIEAKLNGENTVGLGAAAKGNTLINYSGADRDLISVVFDNSSEKQGKVMPASGIPIVALDDCNDYVIDNVVIFPWNIAEELKLAFETAYRGKVNFYTVIPEVHQI